MKRLLLAVASVLCGVLLVMAPGAQATSDERVTNFISHATLQPSGALKVDETITYDFGGESHHGIYRTIPTRYTSDSGTQYRPGLTFGAVTIDGKAVQNSVSKSSAESTLKIGDPKTLTSGIHVYRLQYSLDSIVQPGEVNDILKLNLTGNGWQVPITQVQATIDLGSLVPVGAAQCFTGIAGSTAQNCTVSQAGSIVSVTSTSLAIGEGASAFIDLPVNSVSSHLVPYVAPKPPWYIFVLPAALYVLIVVGFLALIRNVWRAHRLRKEQTIVAQYEAPEGMSPAQLGLLNDDRTGLVEITAMLIDLAVRGHLKITQTQPKKLLSSAKYQFDRLTGKDDLRLNETQLLRAVFQDGATTAKLSDLDQTRMAAAVTKINTQLGDEMTKLGFYRRSPGLWRIFVPAVLLTVAFGALNVGSIFLLSLGGEAPEFAAIPVLITTVVAAVLIAASWYIIRQPYGLTPEGAKLWAQVRGFKSYLMVAEKDRLNFSDAPEKTPELFNKLLPAAIALGVVGQWAKQFEGIDVARSADWYGGSNFSGLSAAAFASSLTSDFSSGVSQNFSPVSSSGSSSGGFSGGGFSGGGGGSW